MKYIIGIAIVLSLNLWMLYETVSADYNKHKTQQQTIDSLQTELHISQSMVGRYELTLELMSQLNERTAAQFDSLYKYETE